MYIFLSFSSILTYSDSFLLIAGFTDMTAFKYLCVLQLTALWKDTSSRKVTKANPRLCCVILSVTILHSTILPNFSKYS